jgi:Spy/CpxP family protein refolding chaperone
MKRAWPFALAALLWLAPAARAEPPQAPPEDPLAQFVFPPELVMRYGPEIGLDEKQKTAIKEAVVRTQARLLDVQWDVHGEAEKLARLLQASTVDEGAVLAQADKVMALEREVKRTHLALLVRIKNLLTDAQKARLSALRKGGDGGR